LGKQRMEAFRLLLILTGKELDGGTDLKKATHPGSEDINCVRQWRGYTSLLMKYTHAIIDEWVRRGYNNEGMGRLIDRFYNNEDCTFELLATEGKIPAWLGEKSYHDSHKSNLLRKDPKFYRVHKWKVADNLPYVWPNANPEEHNVKTV
jgi:hypothetical protein